MRASKAIVSILFLAACNGFVGEATVEKPSGTSVAVVDANYVILRPVFAQPSPGAVSTSVYGRTVYFQPSERILDLRHLDLRTAKLEQTGPEGSYIIAVNTTPVGNKLLRAWTSANLEKQLGVFVGERLISAPVIKSPITDMIILDGEFTREQAEAVLKRLSVVGGLTPRCSRRQSRRWCPECITI